MRLKNLRVGPGAALFGIGALLLVGLAALPATGWLIRQQLRANVNLAALSEPTRDINHVMDTMGGLSTPEVAATAARFPDDLPMQIAAAIMRGHADAAGRPDGVTPVVEHLQALRGRFGDAPSLDANILRFCCTALTGPKRAVEDEFLQSSTLEEAEQTVATRMSSGTGTRVSAWAERPALVAAFVEAAERGERNDPDNAYFPFLRATYLFGVHRDDEALAALERAAVKPGWREYYQDEARGQQALLTAARGETGAVNRTALAAAILFPHYAALRGTARTATALAILREQEGDIAGGLRIRHDLGRFGAKMRVESTCLIGSLVGMAITQVAIARPGGEPPIKAGARETDTLTPKRQAAYIRYLTANGHEAEAVWFAAESKRGAEVKALSTRAQDLTIFSLWPLFTLIYRWGVGQILLVSVFWTLMAGGISSWLSRSPRVWAGEPLDAASRFGWFLFATVPALAIAVAALFCAASDPAAVVGASVALLGGAMLVWRTRLLQKGRSGPQFRAALRIACRTLVAVTGVSIVVAASYYAAVASVTAPLGFIQGLSGSGAGSPGPWWGAIQATVLLLLLAFVAPWLTTAVLAAISWRRRVPVSVGLVRSWRRSALGIAGVLLLTYGPLVLATSRQEAQLRDQLNAMMTHGGRYMASITGSEWPGYVPESSAEAVRR